MGWWLWWPPPPTTTTTTTTTQPPVEQYPGGSGELSKQMKMKATHYKGS